jgi:hypothetical protein
VGRSLDLNSSVSVSSAEANIIVTSEEFIKKVVDRAMTSFVQSQLAPMLEPILSMIQSMHKAPMQLDVAEKVHGNQGDTLFSNLFFLVIFFFSKKDHMYACLVPLENC